MSPDDAEAMVVYKSQPEVCRYVPFEPMDLPAMEAYIEKRLRTELTEVDTGVTMCVEELATGQLVGDVVIMWRSEQHRCGEIGYVFDPAFGGRGYATEATRELLRIGFEEFGWHRMIAHLDVLNTASAKVCERLGMRLEGQFREDEWFKGEWSSTLTYAMLEDEWRAARP
jgi:RimJ/RimL family protein N-acetyltransferase